MADQKYSKQTNMAMASQCLGFMLDAYDMAMVLVKLAWGVVPAYLCERFPTSRRAAGVGLGYSSGALLGAWFSVYVWWAHKIPFIAAIEKQDMWLSPAVILTIGSVMTFVSPWFSPETKHLQLQEVGERERVSDPAKDLAGLPFIHDRLCT